jgi:murein DD-endopeptidase MepM/ murein hydrolase activator NlpD
LKKIFIPAVFLIIAFLIIRSNFSITEDDGKKNIPEKECYREICGKVGKGETLYDIFKKYKLDFQELFKLKQASADVHRLRELYPGQPYKIIIDDNSHINGFMYWINDDNILQVTRTESGFYAEKKTVEYEKKILHIGGIIKDNLISSVGEGRENLMLALELSDIFSWDIDFTTDLRDKDKFKVVAEGLYLDGEFKKYRNILSAEFINNGETYHAYRFEQNGQQYDYYDDEGKSLRRAFLKAPLSFRRISSGFSNRRFHPILKIYRPHHGLDYAAPVGTPVSAVGDGTVIFSGYKGQYGNLVIIRHPNTWKTYYGHLSRIKKDIKKGKKIQQGQVIGYVGSTGLATGPHLHYQLNINNKPVNPLKVKYPQGRSIPNTLLASFRKFKNQMDNQLAAITPTYFAGASTSSNNEM